MEEEEGRLRRLLSHFFHLLVNTFLPLYLFPPTLLYAPPLYKLFSEFFASALSKAYAHQGNI